MPWHTHTHMHMNVNEKKTSKSLTGHGGTPIIKHTESWSRKIQNPRSTWATQWEAKENKQKKNLQTSYFQNISGHKLWLRQGPKEANDNSKSSRASSLKVMYQVLQGNASFFTHPPRHLSFPTPTLQGVQSPSLFLSGGCLVLGVPLYSHHVYFFKLQHSI